MLLNDVIVCVRGRLVDVCEPNVRDLGGEKASVSTSSSDRKRRRIVFVVILD